MTSLLGNIPIGLGTSIIPVVFDVKTRNMRSKKLKTIEHSRIELEDSVYFC